MLHGKLLGGDIARKVCYHFDVHPAPAGQEVPARGRVAWYRHVSQGASTPPGIWSNTHGEDSLLQHDKWHT